MNDDELTQDEMKWEARAAALATEGSFSFAGKDSGFDPLIATTYAEIQSEEDFGFLISALVSMHDAALHLAGVSTPEAVLELVAATQVEMASDHG